MTPENAPAPAPEKSAPNKNKAGQAARIYACRDELNGHFYAMTVEDRQFYNAHREAILQDFNPQSARERWLTLAIAEDMWRLDRARAQENNIYCVGMSGPLAEATAADSSEIHAAACQARVWLQDGHEIQALALYESRIRRVMEKNEKELKAIQTERQAAYQLALSDAQALILLAESENEILPPDQPMHVNGFAFSPGEIISIIRREQRLIKARQLQKQALSQPGPVPCTPLKAA